MTWVGIAYIYLFLYGAPFIANFKETCFTVFLITDIAIIMTRYFNIELKGKGNTRLDKYAE
jgi:hypothetical protein